MPVNHKVVDLCHPIASGLQVYPGDPEVWIRPALTLKNNGARVSAISMGSHSATHLDAPAHTVANGRTVDEISLNELQGEALIIRVPNLAAGQAIGVDGLRLDRQSRVPRIVVISTGWEKWFGKPEYLEHPYLTRQAAETLCEMGMHVLAIDTMSPDQTLNHDGGSFGVHEAVLGSDRLIVENLRGIEDLPEHVQMAFYPLPLAGADGAPVRAVAYL